MDFLFQLSRNPLADDPEGTKTKSETAIALLSAAENKQQRKIEHLRLLRRGGKTSYKGF